MSRFRDEVSLIPRLAWITALVVAILCVIGVGVFLWVVTDKPSVHPDPWFVLMVPLVLMVLGCAVMLP